MASVWEERFKEEAEKTIPLQEVRIGIFGINFFGIFRRIFLRIFGRKFFLGIFGTKIFLGKK